MPFALNFVHPLLMWVLLGLLPEWRFSRELDPATGYAELRITPRAPG